MYNQPNHQYDLKQLPNLLSHFQQPLLIMGDFNAHHPLWDDNVQEADEAGKEIEKLMLDQNYCCLNTEDSHTYFSKTHNTFSSVDLSICSSCIIDLFEWNVLDDTYTSDHYPIIITLLDNNSSPQIPKYNFDKANWEKYNKITENISSFQNDKDHDTVNNNFTNFIRNASDKSIPITSFSSEKNTVP